MKHGRLVLVRHGESRFNTQNIFTGCIDVSLSETGLKEAHRAARHCQKFNYDAVFTSHLERAHETLLVILSEQKKTGIFRHDNDPRYDISTKIAPALKKNILPVFTTRDLNERAYGDLQGMNKQAAVRKYGKDAVLGWRRSFEQRPPKGESLQDVYGRVVVYFEEQIHSRVRSGETVLIVGHGNTLRAIIKFIENIADDQIPYIDLPFAQPLVYRCRGNNFLRIEGEYRSNRPLR